MSPIILAIIVTHLISIATALSLLFEFKHLHAQRVKLLTELHSETTAIQLLEKKILTALYILCTSALIVLTILFIL